jgi:hypothetical protein
MNRLLAALAVVLTLSATAAEAKSPASKVDKATFIRYAWQAARALSGLPDELLDTATPPAEVRIYDELRLIPSDQGWGLVCGITWQEYRGLQNYTVVQRYIVQVYAFESDMLYKTLIHEFLHVIGLQLTDDGREGWVRERFPFDCEWPAHD